MRWRWGWWGVAGGAAVLTTARLTHPEHAELLCFGYWLQVIFKDWNTFRFWWRTTPLCAVFVKTHKLSRKSISYPNQCFLLVILLLTTTPGPSSPKTYTSFNQQDMAASLYFAHYYQTKGSVDFAAGEGFNYSKTVLAPVVCAPWIHLLLRWPVNDLF